MGTHPTAFIASNVGYCKYRTRKQKPSKSKEEKRIQILETVSTSALSTFSTCLKSPATSS